MTGDFWYSSRMTKQVVLITGKPGSGKSTAAAHVAQQLGAYYFSIGDEMRARGLHGKHSPLTAEIQKYAEQLRQHKSVPPHLVGGVVDECINDSEKPLIIIDGYPQYLDRMPGFWTTLKKAKAEVLVICRINISDALATKRLAERKQRVAGIAEDQSYIQQRLDTYHAQTEPAISQLLDQSPLEVIDGTGGKETVATELLEAINHHL